MRTEKILISEIELNEDRTEGGKGDIESLARNMEKYGQINAVTVIEGDSAPFCYRIVAGRRRIAAAEKLGWTEIRADVYDTDEMTPDSEEMIALSENAAREEMNAIDEGILYAKELEKGTPVEELAALFCRNKSTVYQRAKLARLVPEMRDFYKTGKMPLHVAAMASELPEESQKAFAETTKKRGYCADWEIKAEIKNISNDLLRSIGDCAECAVCTKRTHYSDKTLFPELAESDDRCLDHECYCKKLQARIDTAFSEWGEKVKETPELDAWDGKRIVTTVALPDGIQVVGVEISSFADDEDDITETSDEEDARIKEQLESEGKVEWVPCWDGSGFVSVELAKRADVDALYYGTEEEEPEWQKEKKSKLKDIFRAVPEKKLSEILDDDRCWWDWEYKAIKNFKKKMQSAVLMRVTGNDGKNLISEQLALIALLTMRPEEIRESLPEAGYGENEEDCSLAAYEKLLTVGRGDIIRALLKTHLGGYGKVPSMSGLDNSDWQKIFAHLDIDLAKLRDEAAIESVAVESTAEKTAEESDNAD